ACAPGRGHHLPRLGSVGGEHVPSPEGRKQDDVKGCSDGRHNGASPVLRRDVGNLGVGSEGAHRFSPRRSAKRRARSWASVGSQGSESVWPEQETRTKRFSTG